MKILKLSAAFALATLGLFGCDKRSPTTDDQGKGKVESTDPSVSSKPASPVDRDQAQPVSGESTTDRAKQDMKEAGRDIESGAKEVGRDVKEGTQEAGRDIKRETNEAARDVEEKTK